MLAMLPDAKVDAILDDHPIPQITPRTLTDPAAIRGQIALTRENGHALAIEQILMGEVALGVAIPDADGRPIAAIHIAASLSEWAPEDFRRRVAPLAAEAVRSILTERGRVGLHRPESWHRIGITTRRTVRR